MIILDCPSCNSTNLERLENTREDQNDHSYLSEDIIRCNDCRSLFESHLQMYDNQHNAVQRKLQGARA